MADSLLEKALRRELRAQRIINGILAVALILLLFFYLPHREERSLHRGMCMAGADGDDTRLERCQDIHRS